MIMFHHSNTMVLPSLLAIVIITLFSTREVSSFTSDNFVATSIDDFPYDENNRLAEHLMAYPAHWGGDDNMKYDCVALFETYASHDGAYGHTFQPLGAELTQTIFGDESRSRSIIGLDVLDLDDLGLEAESRRYESKTDNSDTIDPRVCPAVCLELGTAKDYVTSPMPFRYWGGKDHDDKDHDDKELDEQNDDDDDDDDDDDYDSYDDHDRIKTTFPRFLSSDACGSVEYGFVNYYGKPLALQWINPSTNEKVFNANLGVGEQKTFFSGTYIGHRFIVDDPETGDDILDITITNAGTIGIGNFEYPHFQQDINKEAHSTHNNEWNRHKVITRTFSKLGFDKGRLPDDIFASMGAYHYNNRGKPHIVREEWGKKGIFVNYWETDVNFIQISHYLKSRWQVRLKRLVEIWANERLETTSMYGMREYTKGARLITHVDREETHAASLIVNIAQGNVTTPWTIEVHDHADRLHEVVMAPGDIVYYESAKCLHGRNTPLSGGYYVNLFTHYRPIKDPRWYVRPNPEGTPEPLLDVGECHLVGDENSYSSGAVQCDNKNIGLHLSPTMFVAKNGDDLYNWWRRVGPDEKKIDEDDGKDFYEYDDDDDIDDDDGEFDNYDDIDFNNDDDLDSGAFDDDDNFDLNKDDIDFNNDDDLDSGAFNDADDSDVNHIIHSTETRHSEL